MADTAANTVAKDPVANTESKGAEGEISLPTITKEPMTTGEASVAPSMTSGAEKADASAPAPAAQAEIPAADAKEDATKDVDAADKVGNQPEKSEDKPASTTEPAASATTGTNAPTEKSGDSAEAPKPVQVEEVRDQDLPKTEPPVMTGALQTDKPADGEAKTDGAPVATTGPETTEVPEVSTAAGDKRKAEAPAQTNGEAAADKANEEEPTEKKQKTNGAAATESPKKPGRPKKDKKAAAPVGRTARKTRSQGTAE
ncbi:hypothetical protein F4780DRAFT_782351 [Xylariomycetidae sp. FL0641]|nr:hypothetical protein F4780DRAFT_782351 [Xylariomycetidae sp. FL0641]